jgi:hypothetical protein
MSLEGKQLSEADKLGVEKYCKYAWHCVAYIFLEAWGMSLQIEAPWSVLNTGTISSVWVDYPHSGTEKQFAKLFMMAQVAWYVHGFFESLIVDKGRSDFLVMLIHHVLSSMLLLGAFWVGAHRVAILVCVEQDLSDILMYISKMVQKSTAVKWTQNKSLHTFLLMQLTVAWGRCYSNHSHRTHSTILRSIRSIQPRHFVPESCSRHSIMIMIMIIHSCNSFLVTPLRHPFPCCSTRVFVLGTIIWTCLQITGPLNIMTPGHPSSDTISIFLLAQLSILWLMQLFWWIGLCKMTLDQTFKGSFNDFFHDTVLNSPHLSLSLSLSLSLPLRVPKSLLICITSRTNTHVSTHAQQRGNNAGIYPSYQHQRL